MHDETKKSKEEIAMDELIERDFPPALVEPWQAKAAAAGLGDWRAHMRPLLGGPPEEAEYTLTLEQKVDEMRVTITTAGRDQDELIERAKAFERRWA